MRALPRLHSVLAVFTSLVLPVSATVPVAESATAAKYVILFQGDGMAARHIQAGGYYVCGSQPCLAWESFPSQAAMTHNNASDGLTDSAASATAMATGVKVNNGVISVLLPGDGSALTSLLELYRDAGRSTGLVTESYLTDASPAAYGAHEASRSSTAGIFVDFVSRSRPVVLLGGGGNGFDSAVAGSQGYTVVSDAAALSALDTETATLVAGGFGSGFIPPPGYPGRNVTLPTLPQMTRTALEILDNDPDGFFVFIEQEGIDEYAHANDAVNLVRSLAELSDAVRAAIDWVDDPTNDAHWGNTLMAIVGDHETGGITAVANSGAGNVPAVTFSTTGHTKTPVRVFAQGAGAEQITGAQIDNTNIFALLKPALQPPAAPSGLVATAVSSTRVDLSWTDNAADENGFKIEASADAATWSEIATVGAGVESYSDTGLAGSTTYYYRVRAWNAAGDSAYTAVATSTTLAPTPPVAPTSLGAAAVSSSRIDLAWTDNATDETGFKIERLDGDGWLLIATVGPNAAAWADTGLSPATAYSYRVRAFSGAGHSGYSNTAGATTLAAVSAIHLGDLDGSRSLAKRAWTAVVTVTVHDAGERPLSGALVNGAWSTGASGTCKTDRRGICSASRSGLNLRTSSMAFTVTGVVKSGAVYAPLANHDPDGDSDGVTITVSK